MEAIMYKTAWILALSLIVAPAYAQTRETDVKAEQAFRELKDAFKQLKGQVAYHDAILKIIADETRTKPDLLEIAKPLARLISQRQGGNQQEEFIQELIRIACQNIEDNCELKRRVSELELRMREWERRNQGGPTPVDPAGFETPVAPPREAPNAPPKAPAEPNTFAPPLPVAPVQPIAPTWRWWNGVPNRIVDHYKYIEKPATVVWSNVKRQFGNDVYYGDVYRDRYGRIIFLKSAEIPMVPYNVARPTY